MIGKTSASPVAPLDTERMGLTGVSCLSRHVSVIKSLMKSRSVLGLVHAACDIVLVEGVDASDVLGSKRELEALEVALNAVGSQTLG